MKMPFRRAVAGAITGVAMAGFAAFADGNHQHATTSTATAPAERKIKYYRNPMGLPDVSPTPKKDSMGMDYIPVYEGEDSDDGTVKLSPGKIQRTGVKSEPAAMRVIRTTVRAPGTIQLDERRVSVISMRSESYVQKVANVTTGAQCRQGPAADGNLQPGDLVGGGRIHLDRSIPRSPAATGLWQAARAQRLMNLDVPEAAIAAMEKSRKVPITIDWTAPRDGIVLERNVDRRHARPARRRAVPHRRSSPWSGRSSMSPSATWRRLPAGQRTIVRARSFPGPRVRRKDQRDLSAAQRRRARRGCASNCPIRNALLIPTCMSMPRSTPAAPEPVLAVPDSAVIDSGSRQVVLVDKGEGRFEPREVKLGRRGERLCRDHARASPRASRSSPRPIS